MYHVRGHEVSVCLLCIPTHKSYNPFRYPVRDLILYYNGDRSKCFLTSRSAKLVGTYVGDLLLQNTTISDVL